MMLLVYRWLVPFLAAGSVLGFVRWRLTQVAWLGRVATGWLFAASLAVAAAWGHRWMAAGHLPLFGTYENALSLALTVVVVAALLEARGRRLAAPVALASAALVLAQGQAYDPQVYALTISERSWVVDVHAFVAWGAFAILVVNAAAALRIAVAGRSEAGWDRWLLGSLSLGFLLHTGMMVSGSIYKFLLFGSVWTFDPIELMGFVVWMAYGVLLHLHLLARWPTVRLARWTLGVFVLLFVSYRAIVWFPSWTTYHIFDVDLRLHIPG